MAENTSNPRQGETKGTGKGEAQPAPFDVLRREIDRLFEDFRAGDWRWPFRRPGMDAEVPWPPRPASWQLAPAMDLVERDGGYEIHAELPGMDEKDIDVKVAGDRVTIRGEKREEREQREKQHHLSERRFGAFQRTFQIPPEVDAARIEASFAKGVLTVSLPKTQEAQKAEKKIEIRSA